MKVAAWRPVECVETALRPLVAGTSNRLASNGKAETEPRGVSGQMAEFLRRFDGAARVGGSVDS